MPLDPSIISSYNPTSGIDLNALMTQRMQGMANINEMERQRRADALALEDRAVAQKKAQEDAAVDALIPAYVYGIDNPTDIEGMLALVPPDMQANVAPYVDQVRGLPPEQVKSLLTSSLLSSDRGKAFLENKARERTYQVQLQQAETAAAREKREAEAAGKPAPMSAYEAARIKLDTEKAAREASGAPTEKQLQGKASLDNTLQNIADKYAILKQEKAIVSQSNTALENAAARASTLTGVSVGRTLGTKAQSARDTIANLRQSVLMDIKAATGMTAKDMDSNQDVQRLLASLGDPDQSYETVLDTIANISAKYGTGKLKVPGSVGGTTTAVPTELPEGATMTNW